MSACPKPKVVRDAKYLAFVRTLPCHFRFWTACNRGDTMGNGVSEVSHLDGKSRDDRCLPCCGGHHRTNAVSWHNGQRTFLRAHGYTKTELIRDAEDLYRAWKENQ